MKVIVEAISTPDIWQMTGAVELRIYSSATFVSSDGQSVLAGQPSDPASPHLKVPCTVLGKVLTIPSFEINSTVDAIDNIYATYTAVLVAGGRRIFFLDSFAVNTLEPGDPSHQWGELILFKHTNEPYAVSDTLLRQLTGMIQLAAGALNKASETALGVTALTTDPLDPSFPIAVSDTDPRLLALLGVTPSGNYASLAAAVTAIGGVETTLRISTANFPNGSTVTVPSTLTLEFDGSGSILMDTGETVTVRSDTSRWPIRKIFNNAVAGQGTISFAGNKVAGDFHPEWWGAVGDDTTDSTAGVQAALTAAFSQSGGGGGGSGSGAMVDLGSGIFKITSQLSIGDGSSFAFVSLKGKNAGGGGGALKWYGSSSGTMLYFDRVKLGNFTDIRFENGGVKGTTVGVRLAGTVGSGTQTNGLIFDTCYFLGFDLGLAAGDPGPVASSELVFRNCYFESNNTGFLGSSTGNTLNILFEMCSFAANVTGADFGTAGAVHVIGGGSNTNSSTTFRITDWQATVHIRDFRFELGPTEKAIIGVGNKTLIVEACHFQATSTVPSDPTIVVSSGLVVLVGNVWGVGAETGWKTINVAEGGNPSLHCLTMSSNVILGSEPFDWDTVSAQNNGLRYILQGNRWTGLSSPQVREEGLIVLFDRVPNEIHGSATFASSGTKVVAITRRESALYDVLIEKDVNESIWVTGKTDMEFTLNSDNPTSTAVINYVLRRH